MSKVTFKNLNQHTKGKFLVAASNGDLQTDSNFTPLKLTANQFNKFVKDHVKRVRKQGLHNFRSEVTAKLNDRNLWVYSHVVI